jgi:hypothetical protein
VGNHPASSVASASQPQTFGNSLHLHHQYNPHSPQANSQKGASILISSEISGRSLKLAQSTVLCQNRSISTKRYPTPETVFAFVIIFFCCFQFLVVASLLSWYNKLSSQTHEVPKVGEARKLFSRERGVHNYITSFAEATKNRSKERSVSLPKQQKVVPKGAQHKFFAQKSFQRECSAYSEK